MSGPGWGTGGAPVEAGPPFGDPGGGVSGAETIEPEPQEGTGLREQKIVSGGSFPAFGGETIPGSLRRGADRDGARPGNLAPFRATLATQSRTRS
jgi:hypothetical protein